MKILNLLQMNDWPIKRFLLTFFALQLAFLICLATESLGFRVHILGQIIGFVYLLFMPGLIVLRIMKLHTLGTIESLLYSVGLSIAFLFFLGSILNVIGLLFSIAPISVFNLAILYGVVLFYLCFICYLRDKDFSGTYVVEIKRRTILIVLALCSLPLLTVVGTYLMNLSGDNVLLLILLPILSIMPLIATFGKFPNKIYVVVVFVVALSLLFHRSLISTNLTGIDIQGEYFFSNLVYTNHFWNSALPYSYNAMLSVVMLAPILSQMCNLNLVWVLKIVYPILFSLVPLGLYRIYQRQTNDKIALLSCAFFMFFYVFFTEMLALARQQIAELFLVLFLLVIIDKKLERKTRSALSIVFILSLTVSHYGLSYIFMFSLIVAWLLLLITERRVVLHFLDRLAGRFSDIRNLSKDLFSAENLKMYAKNRTINSTIIVIFVVSAFVWYICISGGWVANSIVNVFNNIASVIDMGPNPMNTQGLGIILSSPGFGWVSIVKKVLFLTTTCFMTVGFFAYVLTRIGTKFVREYTALSSVSLLILFFCVAVPNFSNQLNTSRMFQIATLFLAPFCIIGGTFILRWTISALRPLKCKISNASWGGYSKVWAIFLVAFLLFNSEWVTCVVTNNISTISLNSKMDYPKFTDGEVQGARWLSNKASKSSTLFGDAIGQNLLTEFSFWQVNLPNRVFWANTDYLPESSFIFFRILNVRQNLVLDQPSNEYVNLEQSTFYNSTIVNSNKLYDNGDSQIYGG
jgi:uncharacterized membrane protein